MSQRLKISSGTGQARRLGRQRLIGAGRAGQADFRLKVIRVDVVTRIAGQRAQKDDVKAAGTALGQARAARNFGDAVSVVVIEHGDRRLNVVLPIGNLFQYNIFNHARMFQYKIRSQ